MKVTSAIFLSAALATSAIANPHAHASHSTSGVVHHNEARTFGLISGLLCGILGGCYTPVPIKHDDFTCSGKGNDGWSFDGNGNTLPSGYPSGFLWFGSSVGWQPPIGWTLPSLTWKAPAIWLPFIKLSPWWTPNFDWEYPTGVSYPCNWTPWEKSCGGAGIPIPGPTYPSSDWECDGSGNDGKDYDPYGNGCPYGGIGFKYFGKTAGWQPAKSWTLPGLKWAAPSAWLPFIRLSPWWFPNVDWEYPTGVSYPCNWTPWLKECGGAGDGSSGNDWPSADWECDKSGNDGKDVDSNGKSCPYGAIGWKWFGKTAGWQPPKSWTVPSLTWSAPSAWLPFVSFSPWWVPNKDWDFPGSISYPCWWTPWVANCGSSTGGGSWPSSTWTCSGSGLDGYDVDSDGKGCPYPVIGWKWFGKTAGWQPPKGWSVPSLTWSAPSAWLPFIQFCPWWIPNFDWDYPSGVNYPCSWTPWTPACGGPPATTTQAPVTTTSKPPMPTATHPSGPDYDNDQPASDWQCNGSGLDGWKRDFNGKFCPFVGVDWRWYGSNYGWQPYKGWKVPSNSWTPPSAWKPSQCSWWAPVSSWIYPVGFSIPNFWISLGWSGYNWAPSSYTCNGQGTDGYDFDHLGNGRPSWAPSGWKYFGVGPQWQPTLGWGLPSKTWVPPAAWSPKYAPWWKPNIVWSIPTGYACPTWWPVSLLKPITGILCWIGICL